jgi:hypothetical protein
LRKEKEEKEVLEKRHQQENEAKVKQERAA